LPPTLVIHLKRFEFDYDRMELKKVNSPCSFPMYMNMEPYTAEGLARRKAEKLGQQFDSSLLKHPSYYDYELMGAVVHTGTIDSGHYYSYIKERIPIKSETSRWFEFNDTNVSLFDVSDIPHETFGGFLNYEIFDKDTMAKKKLQNVKNLITHISYFIKDAFPKKPLPSMS